MTKKKSHAFCIWLLFAGDLVGISPTRLSMKNLKYAIIGYDVYKLCAPPYAVLLYSKGRMLTEYEQNVKKLENTQK